MTIGIYRIDIRNKNEGLMFYVLYSNLSSCYKTEPLTLSDLQWS